MLKSSVRGNDIYVWKDCDIIGLVSERSTLYVCVSEGVRELRED